MLEPLMGGRMLSAGRETGVTLIELLVGLAVLAVLLTVVAPSFTGYLVSKRVEGVANELITDLQFARSESVSRNTLVRVRFNSATQYTIEAESPLPATITCTMAGAVTTLKTVNLPAGVTLQGSSAGTLPACTAVEPVRATAPLAATVEVLGADNRVVRIASSASGRVQACRPTDSKLGGFTPC